VEGGLEVGVRGGNRGNAGKDAASSWEVGQKEEYSGVSVWHDEESVKPGLFAAKGLRRRALQFDRFIFSITRIF
jgi:hypothetical protein